MEQLWRMLDLITPMALRVVATLRIADLIHAGHAELTDLAAAAGADPVALRRVLRYLIARGVFLEPEPDRFALDPMAELLRDDHPSAARRWSDLEGFGGRMDLAFFDMLAVTRKGRPNVTGHEENLSEAEAASYDEVMEAQSRGQAPAIVAAYDFSAAERIVDIGGGTGFLLSAILDAHPRAHGVLLDLPKTAAKAPRLLAPFGARAEIVAGDLFEVLPEGDLHVLKFILHFLEDDQAVVALRRIRAAKTERVLVIERSVEPGEDRTQFTAMDLRMLILGHGRERTVSEYGELAKQAGFAVHTVRTAALLKLIELVPA